MELNPRLLQSEPMRRCQLKKCEAACCLHGVWLDLDEARMILDNVDLIREYMPPAQQNPGDWFDGREEQDPFVPSKRVVHSMVLEAPDHYGGTACVFLRRDHKCALQVAANAAGQHPWHFKPFYCILHPLDLDEQGRITLDRVELLLDEPGSCLRPATKPIPLLVTFEEELRYFLGDEKYQELLLLNQPEK